MADTPWLDDAQRLAWVRFAAVLELLPRSLDAQLERDERLSHFDYYCLAMLSEAPRRTLRMTALAGMTNATLPRLSRVMNRLEEASYVRREPCPADRRATNVVLTDAGWDKVVGAAPGHVAHVRELVIDALQPEQVDQLSEISARLLAVLDPDQKMMASVLHPPA
ncbi:MAG TPA: MarR family winged helix-turn-helix transcriptional regulator [Microlunatus sp.]|nr:MarR family winged helix-turn-helix transcriptional regulator [Microlunatus sp.]